MTLETDTRERIAPRLAGTPLVVLLDVDGTLAPIAPRPSDAVVPAPTRMALAALADAPGVIVGVVSGRSAEDARRLVAVDRAWVVGNHGAEVIAPDGEIAVERDVARFEEAVGEATDALAAALVGRRGVIIENKRWTVTVHYRGAEADRVPQAELHEMVARVAATYGLVVSEGKKVMELRPPVPVDKGTAVLALAERVGGVGSDASVLFAGDDVTDEDAFRTLRARLPRAVTVHVDGGGEGTHETAAEFVVSNPMEMGSLLAWLAAARAAAQ